jgi:O-antigen ligase
VVRTLCAERKTLKRIVWVMIGVALIEALYGLIQALVPTLGVLWVDYVQAYMGNARGTFINRNHFAGFIEMVWPLALGFTLAQGGWGRGYTIKKILISERLNRQALLALGIVMLLLALLFSRSRTGIAGAFIGFVTFFLLVRQVGKGISRYIWILLGGIIVMLVLYSLTIGISPVADRFFTLRGGDSRIEFWRDSLQVIKDHPLGIGLRNYEKVFPVYNVSNLSNKIIDYAHNDYLQLLIEAGWIGFTAVLTGFLIFMVKSTNRIKNMNPHKDPLRFFLAVGAFSGLTSLAFHSFFDFNLQIPANCVYFVTLMAILHSCTRRSADYADYKDYKKEAVIVRK